MATISRASVLTLALMLFLCAVDGQPYLSSSGSCIDFSLISNPSQPNQCSFLCSRFEGTSDACKPALALMKEIIDTVIDPSYTNSSSDLETLATRMFTQTYFDNACYLNMYQDWQSRDYACSDLTNGMPLVFVVQFLPYRYQASEPSGDYYCITTMYRIRYLQDNQLFPSSFCSENGKSLTPLTWDFTNGCPSACWSATLTNLRSATESKGYCCASLYYEKIIEFLYAETTPSDINSACSTIPCTSYDSALSLCNSANPNNQDYNPDMLTSSGKCEQVVSA